MRVAPQVVLTEDQERILRQWARGRSLPARQVERARVVLLAAAGKQDLEIAAAVGIGNQKAARWRIGEGCAAPWAHANYHVGQSAGSGSQDHAGEAWQGDPLEHTYHGRGRGPQREEYTPHLA